MSFFTNDVDTVSEALNNSFATVIQAAVQTVGTLVLMFVLNWRLALITVACDVAIVVHVRYSGTRSKKFYARQQKALGALDGYIEEMVSGQKVVKVFNHEQANVAEFTDRNEDLRQAGTSAQTYAATMVPVTVCIGYVNYAIVAVVGAILAIHGLATVGALASYLVFVRQAAMPFNQVTQLGNFLLNALAGAERLFAAMELEGEYDEGRVTLAQNSETNGRGSCRRVRAWEPMASSCPWLPMRMPESRPPSRLIAWRMPRHRAHVRNVQHWAQMARCWQSSRFRCEVTYAFMAWTLATCRGGWSCTTSTCLPNQAKRSLLWDRPVPVRPPLPTSSIASTSLTRAKSPSMVSTCATSPSRSASKPRCRAAGYASVHGDHCR